MAREIFSTIKKRGPRPKEFENSIAGQVQAMAQYGVPVEQIANAIGMSLPTMRKIYSQYIEMGRAMANTKVGETLFKMATSGECPTATIFWSKTKMGFTEKQKVDLSNEDGTLAPNSIEVVFVPTPKALDE